MKLTKLFLLIPAFTMVACAQNQQGSESQSQTSSSSSEEVKTYEVTEEEFASIITNRGLIALDANQTFDVRGDFTGSALVVTGKADNGTYECFATMTNSEQQTSTLIHSIYQVDQTVPITEDSYHGDYYTQDGAWTVTPNKEMTLDDLMASTAVLYNFEMSEFEFNDKTNQYVATPEKDISLLTFGVTINSVKLQFKNGKLDNYDLDATVKMLGASVPLVLHGQIMDVGSTTIKVPQA